MLICCNILKTDVYSHLQQCWCVVCFAIMETCGYIVCCNSQKKTILGCGKVLFLNNSGMKCILGRAKVFGSRKLGADCPGDIISVFAELFLSIHSRVMWLNFEKQNVVCKWVSSSGSGSGWYGWYCIGKWIRRIYNDMAIYQSLRLEKILDFTLTVDFLDTVYEVDWTHGFNG